MAPPYQPSDKRVILSQRFLVNGSCNHSLPVPFSPKSNVCMVLANFANQPKHSIAHRLSSPILSRNGLINFFQHLFSFLELINFIVRFFQFDGCTDRSNQLFVLPRLQDKIGSTFFKAFYHIPNIANRRSVSPPLVGRSSFQRATSWKPSLLLVVSLLKIQVGARSHHRYHCWAGKEFFRFFLWLPESWNFWEAFWLRATSSSSSIIKILPPSFSRFGFVPSHMVKIVSRNAFVLMLSAMVSPCSFCSLNLKSEKKFDFVVYSWSFIDEVKAKTSLPWPSLIRINRSSVATTKLIARWNGNWICILWKISMK